MYLLTRISLRIAAGVAVIATLLLVTGMVLGTVLPRLNWGMLVYTRVEFGNGGDMSSYVIDTRMSLQHEIAFRYTVWSPDGNSLAVSNPWQHPSMISVAGVYGNDARPIAEAGERLALPAWSPDGEYLVYTHNRPRSGGTLDMVRLTDLETQTLFSSDRELSAPVWSPDGTRILFRSSEAGLNSLWVLTLADQTAQPVLDQVPVIDTAAWSPDSQWIAFTGGQRLRSDGIYLVDREGQNLRQITKSGTSPIWSEDGHTIIYLDASGRWFNRVDMTTGIISRFYTVPGIQENYIVTYPAWRP